jgi:hypothetical protein
LLCLQHREALFVAALTVAAATIALADDAVVRRAATVNITATFRSVGDIASIHAFYMCDIKSFLFVKLKKHVSTVDATPRFLLPQRRVLSRAVATHFQV